MFTITESRIEELLEVIADEAFDYQKLYSAIREEQPDVFEYLNTEDLSFFTTAERAYFEFVIQLLWFIKQEENHPIAKLENEVLADREDSIWGMNDDKYTKESILSSLEIDETLAELILDLMDEETSGDVSEIGREWIFVKTASIASLMFAS